MRPMTALRSLTPTLLLAGLAAAPAAAQIPSNARPVINNAPKLFVATPHVGRSADSANAVAVGVGLRERMERVVGRNFRVVPRDQMNLALAQYGYPTDAILVPTVARRLALELQARTMVATDLRPQAPNQYSATVRLIGTNEEAGQAVTVNQPAGQTGAQFGATLADALKPAIDAVADARECYNQLETNPDKATAAARKALAKLPTSGLAHLCQAELAAKVGQPAESILVHARAAAEGDPLSLKAYTLQAVEYEKRGDSAQVVQAFRQMLLVAPTNEELRKRAFQLFLQYGQAETARSVAEEGLAIDPANPDLYDLKSNACIFLGDYACAVDALEQVIVNDPTKADTLFYVKITATAAAKPDTARLLRWAEEGVRKYPDNASLLNQLTSAYTLAGQWDSVVAVGGRLMQRDTEASTTALTAAKGLVEAGRVADAMPFVDYAAQHGGDDGKQNGAAILTQGGLALLQKQPMDPAGSLTALRKAVELSPAGSPVVTGASYLLGIAAFQRVVQLDPEAQRGKSCDIARQMEGLLQEADRAFTAGRASNSAQTDQYMGYVRQYQPRAASMVKAYCG
jgi:tetratricopeptide (TPR) repeat protein